MIRLGGSYCSSARLMDLSTLIFEVVKGGIMLLSFSPSIESLKGLVLCSCDCFRNSFWNYFLFDFLLFTEELLNF